MPGRSGFAIIAPPVPAWRPAFCSALVLGTAACAASPADRAVERGDFAALRLTLAEREARGGLSDGEAARLARAVAGRDLRTASGAEAVALVRDARPCARELDNALADRMATHDAAGAQAALARIDARGMSMDDAHPFAADPDSAWRAVGARSLVRPQDRNARLRALVDPEPRVRREAARAALDARAPADIEALAEAARLDPERIVRTEAVRAIAATSEEATSAAVRVLRDLWDSADDGLREDIALGWATPGLWLAGGRDALSRVVASGHGPAAVEAAAAVLRHRDAEPEQASAAAGQLERAIEGGPVAQRLQALGAAPLERPELFAAVKAAADSDDLEVRVGALARLTETNDPRVVVNLEALAAPGSSVARRARFALATSGDRRVQAWVEQDLAADRPEVRLAAATELAAMGRAGRAAPLLADGDGRVRVRAACTMILAVRR